ncbi:hypothetical protein [Flexivirga meconopsidis]|uniref:hypothetical protein n=1 Tax=Flexivirga meconopsidis TaxID=2977121 RepID=UPI00224000CA|nr:hypothetical protein [Flexivirga meconopsidis]
MKPQVWERLDVSAWEVVGRQQTGSTENLWLADPDSQVWWLHKDTVIPRNGVEQGEDWSEVASTQVARILGVPCATTRLCIREGRRGSLSKTVRPVDADLWEGQVVLQDLGVPDYFPHTEDRPGVDPSRPKVKRPGHSLPNIKRALDATAPPPGFDGPAALSGFDVFAGYLLLDALIANRDRHEQNWAVLIPRLLDPPKRLSPSYDHASSLGYNLTDDKRLTYLRSDAELANWASKGTAYRFEHQGRPPTLVAHAMNAVGLCSPEGADWWRSRIGTLDLRELTEALLAQDIEGLSHLAATFACELLNTNLRRLRDAVHERS